MHFIVQGSSTHSRYRADVAFVDSMHVVLILTRGAYRITLGDRDLAVAALEKGERTVALDVYPLDGDDPPIRMTIVTNHLVSFYEEGDAGAMDAKPTLEVANVVTLRRA